MPNRHWTEAAHTSTTKGCCATFSFSLVSLVPKLCLGTHFRETPFRVTSTPVRNNIDQTSLAAIIPRTGISPMDRLIDIASLDRIVMDVFQFLNEHLVIGDLFRVTPFLPHLIGAFFLVAAFEGAQLPQDRGS